MSSKCCHLSVHKHYKLTTNKAHISLYWNIATIDYLHVCGCCCFLISLCGSNYGGVMRLLYTSYDLAVTRQCASTNKITPRLMTIIIQSHCMQGQKETAVWCIFYYHHGDMHVKCNNLRGNVLYKIKTKKCIHVFIIKCSNNKSWSETYQQRPSVEQWLDLIMDWQDDASKPPALSYHYCLKQ